MADEIELLRRFRDETPGPSTDAWLRARAAVAAARADESVGHAPGWRLRRRRMPPVAPLLPRRHHRRTVNRWLAAASTAALAAAAGAAAVATLAPRHHPSAAQLTAWTVVTQANGNVVVTIRELRRPGGLQQKLRADGIPASVTFGHHRNSSCRPYPAAEDLLGRIFPVSQAPPPRTIQVIIHPSALPSGAGVQLADGAIGEVPRDGTRSIGVGMVHASPRCTGP